MASFVTGHDFSRAANSIKSALAAGLSFVGKGCSVQQSSIVSNSLAQSFICSVELDLLWQAFTLTFDSVSIALGIAENNGRSGDLHRRVLHHILPNVFVAIFQKAIRYAA